MYHFERGERLSGEGAKAKLMWHQLLRRRLLRVWTGPKSFLSDLPGFPLLQGLTPDLALPTELHSDTGKIISMA